MWNDVFVELALAGDADDMMRASEGWTDISESVRGFSGTLRGRSYELGEPETGSISVRLDNSDGRFTPARSASPYYPYIRANRRLRIRGKNMAAVNTALTGGKDHEDSSEFWAEDNSAIVETIPLNKAQGCTVTSSYGSATNLSYITNGHYRYVDEFAEFGTGSQNVVVDLGESTMLDAIHVWGRWNNSLIRNGTFELGIDPWVPQMNATLQRSSAYSKSGKYSLWIAPDGVSATPGARSELVPVTPGERISTSSWLRPQITGDVAARINYYDGNGTYLSTTGTYQTCTGGQWTLYTVSGEVPANAATAAIHVIMSGTPTTYLLVDDAKIERETEPQRFFAESTVEISPDGAAWQMVFDSADSGEYGETERGRRFRFDPTLVRYIRYTSNGSNLDALNECNEIQAYHLRSPDDWVVQVTIPAGASGLQRILGCWLPVENATRLTYSLDARRIYGTEPSSSKAGIRVRALEYYQGTDAARDVCSDIRDVPTSASWTRLAGSGMPPDDTYRAFMRYEADYASASNSDVIYQFRQIQAERPSVNLAPNPDFQCQPPAAFDRFGRTASGSWGSATTGQTWDQTSGHTYSVASGYGYITQTAVGTTASLLDHKHDNFDLTMTVSTDRLNTAGTVLAGFYARFIGADYYHARLWWHTNQTITVEIYKHDSVGFTLLGESVLLEGMTHVANQRYTVRFRGSGPLLSLKAWEAEDDEPDYWNLELEDTTFARGDQVGIRTYVGDAAMLSTVFTVSDFRLNAEPVRGVELVNGEAHISTESPYSGTQACKVEWGPPAGGLQLTGEVGDNASTPDHLDFDIGNALDVRVDMTLDSYEGTGSSQYAISQYNATGDQRSWAMGIQAGGNVRCILSTTGTGYSSVSSNVPVPVPGGERVALRWTVTVNNVTGDYEVRFYWANSMVGPWLPLGDVRAGTFSGTRLFNSQAAVVLGALENGTLMLGNGILHSAEIRNGIDGTIVAKPQPALQPEDTTSFTDSAGKLWTLNGNSTILESGGNQGNMLIPWLRPGITYTAGMWLKVPTGSPEVQLFAETNDEGSAAVSANDTWALRTVTFLAEKPSHYLAVKTAGVADALDVVYLDQVQVNEGETVDTFEPIGATAFAVPRPVFEGWVERWPVVQSPTGIEGEVAVVVNDRLNMVGQQDIDGVMRQVLQDDWYDVVLPLNEVEVTDGKVGNVGWVSEYGVELVPIVASLISGGAWDIGNVDGPTGESALDLTSSSSGTSPDIGYSLQVPGSVANVPTYAQPTTPTAPTAPPPPPPPPPTLTKKSYTKTYYATWSRSYEGDGSIYEDYGVEPALAYQGYWSGTHGNTRSMFGFDYKKIMADLKGASITGCTVTLDNEECYAYSGTTVVVGTHTNASKPSSWRNAKTDRVRRKHSYGAKVTASLGTAVGKEFRAGSTKGIVIGPGPSTSHYYFSKYRGAKQTGKPYLKITYWKYV